MRIVQLTPGTGNFHCGNCLRDAALVTQWRQAGHDVLMVPLYLPQVTDGQDLSDTPVFFGGINVYLQQKSALFRRTPAWLDRWLDRPRLLRWIANHAAMTSSSELGRITVSMLRGEEGLQAKELARLTDFLAHGPPVDVVCLSNALLMGLAAAIRQRTGARILCTLSGEDSFLDWLREPYRAQAWQLMREQARHIDAFVAVSDYYARAIAPRLGLGDGRLHIVHNGIDPQAFEPRTEPSRPTIGYLAYMSAEKGLTTLIDAFIDLCRGGAVPQAMLRIAGAVTPVNRHYVAQQRRRLQAAGLEGRFEFLENIDAAAKRRFLASLSVLSVPAVYGEAFGLYVLEAWSAKVPVVQPRHGAFPELIEPTGGGILCRPGDAGDLARALADVLRDAPAARRMGEAGYRAVCEHFNIRRVASSIAGICGELAKKSQPAGA